MRMTVIIESCSLANMLEVTVSVKKAQSTEFSVGRAFLLKQIIEFRDYNVS